MKTERKNTVADSQLNIGRDGHIGDNKTIINHNRGLVIVTLALIVVLCILVFLLINRPPVANQPSGNSTISQIPDSSTNTSLPVQDEAAILEPDHKNNNSRLRISGHILDENGAPLDSVLIMISGYPKEIHTSAAGFFSVNADFFDQKGEYTLTISKSGYEPITQTYFELIKMDITERLTKKLE